MEKGWYLFCCLPLSPIFLTNRCAKTSTEGCFARRMLLQFFRENCNLRTNKLLKNKMNILKALNSLSEPAFDVARAHAEVLNRTAEAGLQSSRISRRGFRIFFNAEMSSQYRSQDSKGPDHPLSLSMTPFKESFQILCWVKKNRSWRNHFRVNLNVFSTRAFISAEVVLSFWKVCSRHF